MSFHLINKIKSIIIFKESKDSFIVHTDSIYKFEKEMIVKQFLS
ncbi:MAG: hypothetical protein ACTHJ7_02830 [Candidatus Nitrosocosmicus sp.]